MAAPADGDGSNQSEITMFFTERYYELEDTFMIDATKQQFFVMEAPVRRDDSCWEYHVRIVSGDAGAMLPAGSTYTGMKTRWVGNLKQEWHDTGFVKYQSKLQLLLVA